MQPMTGMQPTPPVAEQRTKGTVCLALGAVLLVGGIVFGIVMIVNGVSGFSRSIDRMQRVSLTSGGTVDLGSSGTYRMYLERPGTQDDPFAVPANVPGITVIDPDGGLHAIENDRVDESYSYNGRSGQKLGKFDAPSPGIYRIRVTGADGAGFGTLAVAKNGPFHSIAPILFGVFGGGAMVVTGIVLLVIGGIRRSRSRRMIPHPIGGWAPPPSAWGAPGAPAGWAPPAQPGYGWAPPPVASPAWSPPGAPPYGTSPSPLPPPPPPPSSAPAPPPATTPPAPPAAPPGPDDAGWGAPGAGE
jgi:hypothetical protein